MGSGLLLAIVLGLWGIVLYPTFAKKRIESNETKSIDRFNKAMKSISELIPERKVISEKFSSSAAKRRRNITYFLFVSTIVIIIASYLNYVPQFVSFIPLGILLIWLLVAFIAAQRIINENQKPIVTNVLRKNYVIYKKPIESKTLIKSDPERDLIMDERPYEKVSEPKTEVVFDDTDIRKAQGA